MEVFKYFFTNKAYLPSDLPGRLFSTAHIIVMCLLIVAVPLLAFLLRKMDKKKMRIMFFVIWAVISALEIVKIVWESCTNPNGFEVTGILPLYLCSIFMYVTPFALMKKDNIAKRCACSFLCTLGLVGGLVNFVYPVNVLSSYSVFSFAGLHTLIYHACMVFVPLLMLFSGYYSFSNFKDSLLGAIPVFIVSIPANIINFVYGCSYMFFRGGSVFDILYNAMPEWTYIILLYVLYFLVPILFYLPSLIIRKCKGRKEKTEEVSQEKNA